MPRPQKLPSPLMRPLVALAIPGMYLFYKYDQYRRQQQEVNKRKVAEKELAQLHHKIDKLLAKLEEHEPELATSQEDECVICISAKATMQTYPCAHRVVCRKCFVKTIQMAVSERVLPLRCVICRTKILRLKQGSSSTSTGTTTPSYCTGSRGGVSDTHSVSSHKTYPNPNSHQGTFVRAVKQQMKELSGKETTSNNKIIVSGRKAMKSARSKAALAIIKQ